MLSLRWVNLDCHSRPSSVGFLHAFALHRNISFDRKGKTGKLPVNLQQNRHLPSKSQQQGKSQRNGRSIHQTFCLPLIWWCVKYGISNQKEKVPGNLAWEYQKEIVQRSTILFRCCEICFPLWCLLKIYPF